MLQTCSFAPLRLEFDADRAKGTIFEGHKNLKLGTHCRDNDLFEQYVPREYTAYRIYNLFTPRSFRARLLTFLLALIGLAVMPALVAAAVPSASWPSISGG